MDTCSTVPKNRLLAALPAADLGLLRPHLQNVRLGLDTVLVRSGDQLDNVYFPHCGAIAFTVEVPEGRTVTTGLVGSQGTIGSLRVLGPSTSPITATTSVAGTASQIPVARLQFACARSLAVRHVVQVHLPRSPFNCKMLLRATRCIR